MPFEIDLGNPPAGYTLTAARPDEKVAVQFLEFTSSEDGQHFIQRLEGLPSDILHKLSRSICPSQVDSMLTVVRRDATATVYVNELVQLARVRVSRPVEAGLSYQLSVRSTCKSDDLLDAMLREVMQPHVRCGDTVIVSEYSGIEWRRACEFVNGELVRGELRVRAARQECQKMLRSDETHDPLFAVAEHHLQEATLLLSGRLVPHDEF